MCKLVFAKLVFAKLVVVLHDFLDKKTRALLRLERTMNLLCH